MGQSQSTSSSSNEWPQARVLLHGRKRAELVARLRSCPRWLLCLVRERIIYPSLTEPTTQKHEQPLFQIALKIIAKGHQIGACNYFRRNFGWIAQWPEADE